MLLLASVCGRDVQGGAFKSAFNNHVFFYLFWGFFIWAAIIGSSVAVSRDFSYSVLCFIVVLLLVIREALLN